MLLSPSIFRYNLGEIHCDNDSFGELPCGDEAKELDEELDEIEDENGFPIETLEELPEDISSESWNLILSEESEPEDENIFETNTQFAVEAD